MQEREQDEAPQQLQQTTPEYGAQLQAAMLSREHEEITKNMKAMAASRTHEQFKIDVNDRAVFFSKATGRPFVGDQVNNGCHSASYVANMQ